MAGLPSIRKRISSVKQTKRVVKEGTSTTYTSEKTALEAGISKAKAGLKALEKDHESWQKCLTTEREVLGLLGNGEETKLQQMLREGSGKVDLAIAGLTRKSSPFAECLRVAEDFIREGSEVMESMKEVEGLLAERRRYEGKVEKLVKKAGKASEKKEGKEGGKVERNLGKLSNAREVFEKAEKEAVEKAKALNGRFEEVVEAIVQAFWGRRVRVLKEFVDAGKDLMQWASERPGEEKVVDWATITPLLSRREDLAPGIANVGTKK